MPVALPSVKDDQEAYQSIPQMRWVYHKPLLYDRIGVHYGLYPSVPDVDAFPVVVKPSINLYGLGRGADLAHNDSDIANAPGCLWMPLAKGDHWSVDALVLSPDDVVTIGVKGFQHPCFGLFSYWMRAEVPSEIEARVLGIVDALDIARGTINVEMIGDTPIEVHLRGSDEFERLHKGEARYARPIFAPFFQSLTDDDVARRLRGYPHKSWVTGDDQPEYSAPGWYRYAIVYGNDLAALKQASVF